MVDSLVGPGSLHHHIYALARVRPVHVPVAVAVAFAVVGVADRFEQPAGAGLPLAVFCALACAVMAQHAPVQQLGGLGQHWVVAVPHVQSHTCTAGRRSACPAILRFPREIGVVLPRAEARARSHHRLYLTAAVGAYCCAVHTVLTCGWREQTMGSMARTIR